MSQKLVAELDCYRHRIQLNVYCDIVISCVLYCPMLFPDDAPIDVLPWSQTTLQVCYPTSDVTIAVSGTMFLAKGRKIED